MKHSKDFDFVLNEFGIPYESASLNPVTSGLINRTWKVTQGNHQFILQQINQQVFSDPYQVADNVRRIDQYLKTHAPSYFFVSQLRSRSEKEIVQDGEGSYFRLFPYVKGSYTFSTVHSPAYAFEAAFQFGKFAKLLSRFNSSKLHLTIPNFHNLPLRYQQFEEILAHGNRDRIKQSATLIAKIKRHQDIIITYNELIKNPQVVQRATHHDTKISNVLFDAEGKGICVIDLDTVMPGYFISDVGDMMRTYLSPANEEEMDFGRIEIREEYFKAILQGYLENMATHLTRVERDFLFYSGRFMIFMQGLRFLSDYCNMDTYFGASYPEQNLVRAANQMDLLEKLEDKKNVLMLIIANALNTRRHFPMS